MASSLSPTLNIRLTGHERLVLHVSGEMDAFTSGTLSDTINDVLQRDHRPSIALDLGATTFLDCAGMGVLVSVAKRVTDAGGDMTITRVSPPLRRVMTIAGLGAILPVEEDAA